MTRKSTAPKTKTAKSPSRGKSKRGKTPGVRSPQVNKGSSAKADSTTSFPPTLGELDLHLFGEGKHLRIYDKLGAHMITLGRKRGVAFAVWAPAADRVSVVGDFNDWDATKHPLRPL